MEGMKGVTRVRAVRKRQRLALTYSQLAPVIHYTRRAPNPIQMSRKSGKPDSSCCIKLYRGPSVRQRKRLFPYSKLYTKLWYKWYLPRARLPEAAVSHRTHRRPLFYNNNVHALNSSSKRIHNTVDVDAAANTNHLIMPGHPCGSGGGHASPGKYPEVRSRRIGLEVPIRKVVKDNTIPEWMGRKRELMPACRTLCPVSVFAFTFNIQYVSNRSIGQPPDSENRDAIFRRKLRSSSSKKIKRLTFRTDSLSLSRSSRSLLLSHHPFLSRYA